MPPLYISDIIKEREVEICQCVDKDRQGPHERVFPQMLPLLKLKTRTKYKHKEEKQTTLCECTLREMIFFSYLAFGNHVKVPLCHPFGVKYFILLSWPQCPLPHRLCHEPSPMLFHSVHHLLPSILRRPPHLWLGLVGFGIVVEGKVDGACCGLPPSNHGRTLSRFY